MESFIMLQQIILYFVCYIELSQIKQRKYNQFTYFNVSYERWLKYFKTFKLERKSTYIFNKASKYVYSYLKERHYRL